MLLLAANAKRLSLLPSIPRQQHLQWNVKCYNS